MTRGTVARDFDLCPVRPSHRTEERLGELGAMKGVVQFRCVLWRSDVALLTYGQIAGGRKGLAQSTGWNPVRVSWGLNTSARGAPCPPVSAAEDWIRAKFGGCRALLDAACGGRWLYGCDDLSAGHINSVAP